MIVPGFLPDTLTSRAEIAQYYQSISRVDQGLGATSSPFLKESGHWDDTLLIYISDHGIAMPGAKTTLYEGGMHSPCIVRNPYEQSRGVKADAMVSWVDLTPTILDYAGGLDKDTGNAKKVILEQFPDPPKGSQRTNDTQRGEFHGRSFLSLLDGKSIDG